MKKLLQKLLPKPQPCQIAVDIGSDRIKVMEITFIKGIPNFVKIGSVQSPPLREGGKLDEEKLVAAISRLIETTGITGSEVVTSITGSKVITRQIKVPLMPDSELDKVVQAEAKKQIPLPLEDLTVRYVKLGEENLEGANFVNILLIAAPTLLVEQYYHIFMAAGLKIMVVDLQAFSLCRLFRKTQLSTNEGNKMATAVLDIGSNHSQLVIMNNGVIKFVRVMAVGGVQVTEVIANNYQIRRDEAQQLKEEWGQIFQGQEELAATSFPAKLQLAPFIREAIDNLAWEVSRSLDFYRSQPGSIFVSTIILTGGTSKLKGLAVYLTEKWGIDTKIMVPDYWQNYLSTNEGCPLEYDPSFAVSLGLLMGEAEQCTG